MSQIDSVRDRTLAIEEVLAIGEDAIGTGTTEAVAYSELQLTSADYQALLSELAEAQALDQERLSRIHHLEQALDQAMTSLEEQRLKLKDQEVLEGQLAATEEFASVQQQVIARFKLQLAEQQQALDAQILETQQRDQAIQELLATIETMTRAQQQEIEKIRLRLSQDQQDAQTSRSRVDKQLQDLQAALESRQQRVSSLESETLSARTLTASLQGQLETSQQQIKELSGSLRQYRSSLAQLEAQIEQTHMALEARQTLASSQHPIPAVEPPPIALQQELAGALRQIEALEEQLAQQTLYQTRSQQTQQELTVDRDRLQAREAELEKQTAEMQEQILQQAQQTTEYETGVQYWRDRHATSQRQMAHTRDLVEQALAIAEADNVSPTLIELLAALQTIQPAMPPEHLEPLPIAMPLPRLGTVELPNFLVRRRAQAREGASKG